MDIIPQLVINSIIAAAIYALVALGFNVIYGVTKFFNLAHGAMIAVGGYAVFFLGKQLGLHSAFSFVAGILVAGAFGFLLERYVYVPLRRRTASPMVLLVASLGAFTALQAVLAIIFTSQFRTLSRNAGGTAVYEIFGGVITHTQVWILVAAAVSFVALWFLLYKTLFGTAARAISSDEEVARIIGIHTDRIIGRVFFIGSAIAGLAGIVVGYDTGIEPTMGFSLLLKGVVAAIVGGIGTIQGALLGAVLLGFVENFGIWKISGEWKDAIAFGLLIVFLLFRPRGIWNT